MPYAMNQLNADDDPFAALEATNWGYDNPSDGSITVYNAGNVWPVSSPSSQQDTSSWWNSITGALVPISQAAANIIRAVGGQPATTPVPAGYTRNAAGQLVPVSSVPAGGLSLSSLAVPALLGIGAVMLLRKK